MEPTNLNFQNRYPLSKKKFLKKMIEKILALLLVCLSLSAPILIVIFGSGFSSLGFTALFYTVLVLLVIFLIISSFYAFYVKLYIKNYVYDGGSDFLTIKKGVITPTEIHVQYQKIQDVYVDQDIIDRLLGLYDVHIASATVTSGIEAHIDGVEQSIALGIKDFLFSKIKGENEVVNASQSIPTAYSSSIESSDANILETISSETYPISPLWVFQNTVSSVVTAILVSLLCCFIIFLKSLNSSKPALTLDVLLHALNLTRYQFGSICFFVFIAFVLIAIVYSVLWKKYFSFIFTEDYILLSQGIIGKEQKNLPYRTIQDVTVEQGFMERFCKISTITIQNAASQVTVDKHGRVSKTFDGIVIPGQPIAKANEIAEKLKMVLQKVNVRGTGL